MKAVVVAGSWPRPLRLGARPAKKQDLVKRPMLMGGMFGPPYAIFSRPVVMWLSKRVSRSE